MAAPTTLQGMIQEINSSNLQDGQTIKQLLLDMVTFISANAVASVPVATKTTFGTVEMAAKTTATGGTDTTTQTNLNSLLTALIAAGIMSPT